MTSVPVKNLRGEVVGSFDLDDRVFGITPNQAVVHQVVVAQLANQRKGTHDTKTRGEVRGGTHKMWRQKGTGRARQGDRRAPHWVGGGVVFGPHPRSYHKDVPRKMRRLAMKSALSARVAEEAVTVVDSLTLPTAKTKEMRSVLEALGLTRGALVVLPERDEIVARAAHNLQDVRIVAPGGVNLLDVLKFKHVVFTRPAIEALTEQLLKAISRGRAAADGDEAAGGGPSAEMGDTALVVESEGTPADVANADAAEQVADDQRAADASASADEKTEGA